MAKLKHNYTGSSLLELRDKFGIGKGGFYDNDWWLDEDFAKDKAPKGIYEIDFDTKLFNLTYEEQKKKLKKGWHFPQPAIIAEAILTHYEKTGERLLEEWWSRANVVASGGRRVGVGFFGSDGLGVGGYWDDCRGDNMGALPPSRKLKSLKAGNLDSLEDRIIELEKFKEKVEKFIK